MEIEIDATTIASNATELAIALGRAQSATTNLQSAFKALAGTLRLIFDWSIVRDRRVARRLARRHGGRFTVRHHYGRRVYQLTGDAADRAFAAARGWQ